MKLPTRPLIALGFVIIAVTVAYFTLGSESLGRILAIKERVLAICRENPYLIFLAIAILPSFVFPVSPLLILAGAAWGASPTSCGIALIAVLLNITWTHLLSAGWGRKTVEHLLGKYWNRWKHSGKTHQWQFTFLLRITPGIPLCVQNYLLALLGIPLRYSLAIAIPTSGLYVCGFVLTGGAIFEGETGLLILGVSILIVASLTLKMIQTRLIARRTTPE